MAMVKRVCWCGKEFEAKQADVDRGWAKACSKSHAAHARELRLDRYGFRSGGERAIIRSDHDHALDDQGWDAHKSI